MSAHFNLSITILGEMTVLHGRGKCGGYGDKGGKREIQMKVWRVWREDMHKKVWRWKYTVNGNVVGKGVKMKGKSGLRRKTVKKYIDIEDLLAELTQFSNRLGVGTRTKCTWCV